MTWESIWPERVPRSLPLPETSLHYNLEVSAGRYPGRAAIIYYGAEISFSRLYDEVERLAGFLQKSLGVEKGERVMLYLQNSPQFVIGYYAALRAGAVVVPVNPMLVAEEITHYAEDSGGRVALAGAELAERISPLMDDGHLDHLVVARYGDYIEKDTDLAVPDSAYAAMPEGVGVPWHEALDSGDTLDPPEVGPDDLACLPYTSGTTGRPKGCRHTHRTVQANVVGAAVFNGVTLGSVSLATLPFFHVTGMQHSMNAPVYNGGAMVLMTRWDRETAAELIQRYRVTHWTNISTMVVDFLADPRIESRDLSSLALVGGGGAALPAAVGEKLERLTGVRYAEGYGLSETISQTHMNPPHRPKLQCLGLPAFDVDSRIVDPETLEELGPGEQGEIVSSGPQVMQGYWNRPEADEESFFERDGKRFLRTGDLGTRDEEGYFFLVDRLKRMINASGYKVWPSEVESALYEHPAIQEACVIGVPDERAGETVRAVVVLDEGHEEISGEDITGWARERMAAYKYPREVEIADSLPKSASGKILWRQLQEQYAPQK
ncbi:long-chain fatty acid--CoA ligase [Rubrobacter aplysinae]|uniref:long-chain fatty acid--CoA ligase n=1 Tax=Rubrobacter aplysinae TaxID=909625 RepID=UPI00064C47D4|nr:long-chain fatty acid--CoA ligase [Rubrobacter aplysinae]